jgi:WbqC-like protein family
VGGGLSAKRVAIVQSNYIPWKGYFDLIHSVDEFVLFDDVQYTRRDWRNRNRIKTPAGSKWLTIPVNVKGRYLAPIKDIVISDSGWAERHWKTIQANYARAPFFATYADRLEAVFANCVEPSLSAINAYWIHEICSLLGIRTKISWSTDYSLVDGRTERLISLCQQATAGVYVSGPSARGYLDAASFDAAGIELVYFDYSGYPEYSQLFPPFDHFVSVLDLILNEGSNATRYMLSF